MARGGGQPIGHMNRTVDRFYVVFLVWGGGSVFSFFFWGGGREGEAGRGLTLGEKDANYEKSGLYGGLLGNTARGLYIHLCLRRIQARSPTRSP